MPKSGPYCNVYSGMWFDEAGSVLAATKGSSSDICEAVANDAGSGVIEDEEIAA
ncbi:MAG: hypothetical protein ETSY2_51495 [Candidatus Entotheonella gemina]|uniref:Uncharacterized protein n=1 Tax=Candidatus Entotheonella gemina TaxID=1429439 RepID=W4L7R9_9BACT|nr:MAG: hypothetical protein ETSY2_51495 [Candidatus Entotheonella gemina]